MLVSCAWRNVALGRAHKLMVCVCQIFVSIAIMENETEVWKLFRLLGNVARESFFCKEWTVHDLNVVEAFGLQVSHHGSSAKLCQMQNFSVWPNL